jgi:hypothetical protein
MFHKIKLITVASFLFTLLGFSLLTANVWASPITGVRQAAASTTMGATDPAINSGNCTDVKKCDLIDTYINPFIKFLAALVGVGVTISIIMGGIQYASSAGDPQKVAAAKGRIRNSLVALVVFIFLYALLNFLIPGGLV